MRKNKSDAQRLVESALALSNMTQTMLATKLGTSLSALNQRLSRGKLTLEEYKQIAQITNLRFVCRYEEQ